MDLNIQAFQAWGKDLDACRQLLVGGGGAQKDAFGIKNATDMIAKVEEAMNVNDTSHWTRKQWADVLFNINRPCPFHGAEEGFRCPCFSNHTITLNILKNLRALVSLHDSWAKTDACLLMVEDAMTLFRSHVSHWFSHCSLGEGLFMVRTITDLEYTHSHMHTLFSSILPTGLNRWAPKAFKFVQDTCMNRQKKIQKLAVALRDVIAEHGLVSKEDMAEYHKLRARARLSAVMLDEHFNDSTQSEVIMESFFQREPPPTTANPNTKPFPKLLDSPTFQEQVFKVLHERIVWFKFFGEDVAQLLEAMDIWNHCTRKCAEAGEIHFSPLFGPFVPGEEEDIDWIEEHHRFLKGPKHFHATVRTFQKRLTEEEKFVNAPEFQDAMALAALPASTCITDEMHLMMDSAWLHPNLTQSDDYISRTTEQVMKSRQDEADHFSATRRMNDPAIQWIQAVETRNDPAHPVQPHAGRRLRVTEEYNPNYFHPVVDKEPPRYCANPRVAKASGRQSKLGRSSRRVL